MEKKFGKLVTSVGKNTKDLLQKSKNIAIQAVDQNDDGKFDLEDVSSMIKMMMENLIWKMFLQWQQPLEML